MGLYQPGLTTWSKTQYSSDRATATIQVLLWGGISDLKIVDITKTEFEYDVHELLKSLSCITQTKWHTDKFVQSEGGVMAHPLVLQVSDDMSEPG